MDRFQKKLKNNVLAYGPKKGKPEGPYFLNKSSFFRFVIP